MTCAKFEELLSDYLDGTLGASERNALETHAAACPGCRALMADAQLAIGFMRQAVPPVVPPELVTQIVYHAPRRRVREAYEREPFWQRTLGRWFRPAREPRFAMGMAMTILSFAMLGRCTGVSVQQIRPADLNPVRLFNNLENRTVRLAERAIKRYEDLRLVLEIEARLREFQEQDEAAGPASSPTRPAAGRAPQGGANRK